MKRYYSAILTMMAFAAVMSLSAASAEAGATYYSNTDPGTAEPPAAPWTLVPGGGVALPGAVGGKIWLGKTNLYWPTNHKDWTITISGAAYNKYGVSATHGYEDTVPPTEHASMVTGITDDAANQTRTITVRFIPQPDWEVIEVMRTAALKDGEREDYDVDSYSHCTHMSTDGDETNVDDAWFGAEGDSDRITEVIIFPDTSEVDPGGAHTLTAPGTWFSEIVYTDPDGNPRPQGGVRWYTTGPGLAAMDNYSLTLVTMDPPVEGESYSYYAYDDEAGEWQFFRLGMWQLPIPTTSEWGLIVLTLLLLTAGTIVFGRRRRPAAA